MLVCLWNTKCVGGITCEHAQSQFWAVKTYLCYPRRTFRLYARAALACTKKKCSLRNEKLKASRASETEEKMKERLRIRRENKKTRKPKETEPGHYHKIEAR